MITAIQKKNRFADFEAILKTNVSDKCYKSIKYLSVRKPNTIWIVLIGIENLDFQNEILQNQAHILLGINEILKESSDKYDRDKTVKKITLFEFNMQKKAEKDELLKKWFANPFDFGEIPQKYEKQITDEYVIFKNKKFYWEKEAKHLKSNKVLKMRVYLDDYDFIAPPNSYGKVYKYILESKEAVCYTDEQLNEFKKSNFGSITLSNKIGFVIAPFGNIGKSISLDTYKKWRKLATFIRPDEEKINYINYEIPVIKI